MSLLPQECPNCGRLQSAVAKERVKVAQLRHRNGVLERAVQVAADAIAAALAGVPTGLGEMPDPSAEPGEWHDWLIGRGASALAVERVAS